MCWLEILTDLQDLFGTVMGNSLLPLSNIHFSFATWLFLKKIPILVRNGKMEYLNTHFKFWCNLFYTGLLTRLMRKTHHNSLLTGTGAKKNLLSSVQGLFREDKCLNLTEQN